MGRIPIYFSFLGLLGCSNQLPDLPNDYEANAHEAPTGLLFNYPASKIEKDSRPAFFLDAAKPYRFEFGRGSGWHGLNTITITHEGTVVLYRLRKHRQKDDIIHYSWERTKLQLPAPLLEAVLKAVESNGVLSLDKAYHADVHDGMQWVLWVQQGEKEKSIYFNNHFPEPIIGFASRLDAIMMEGGVNRATWQEVASDPRAHEKRLWRSIR